MHRLIQPTAAAMGPIQSSPKSAVMHWFTQPTAAAMGPIQSGPKSAVMHRFIQPTAAAMGPIQSQVSCCYRFEEVEAVMSNPHCCWDSYRVTIFLSICELIDLRRLFLPFKVKVVRLIKVLNPKP